LNCFADDLAESDGFALDPIWRMAYSTIFPEPFSMKLAFDKESQKAGIDRIVEHNGKVWTFDDKYRRNDFGDILLEYESSQGRPGWVKKNMKCTGITYLVRPSRRVFFINFKALRESWALNEAFYMGFDRKHANNGSYVTKSVAIPIHVMHKMLGGWFIEKSIPKTKQGGEE